MKQNEVEKLIEETNDKLQEIAREIYDRGAEDHKNQTKDDPADYLDDAVSRMVEVHTTFAKLCLGVKV